MTPSLKARRKVEVVAATSARLAEDLIGEARESTEPVITELERQSPLWKKLKAHLEKRIETLRARNDSDRDAFDTAKIRGRIAEVKVILMLDQPQQKIKVERVND